jgi:hypothetical protein
MQRTCRNCGSTQFQALADARTLSLQKEFQSGAYTCCQIVAWADEQWLAWLEAAQQDGKSTDEVTRPLEYQLPQALADLNLSRGKREGNN